MPIVTATVPVTGHYIVSGTTGVITPLGFPSTAAGQIVCSILVNGGPGAISQEQVSGTTPDDDRYRAIAMTVGATLNAGDTVTLGCFGSTTTSNGFTQGGATISGVLITP
jgi:hypothetical protein